MKEFFKNNKAGILGVTAIVVIITTSTLQDREYCTENIWVDDEKHSETDSWIEGNYCVDKKDSLMYPFKAELEARLKDTVNAETTEYLDGFLTSVDYKGCYNLAYFYVHTQIVYENFNEDLKSQYHLDAGEFYKRTTGVDEFDYFELERIGLENECFK